MNRQKRQQLTDLHQVNGHQQLNISHTFICVRPQLVLCFSHTTNLLWSGIVVVFFEHNHYCQVVFCQGLQVEMCLHGLKWFYSPVEPGL